jgi:hypothetical protein
LKKADMKISEYNELELLRGDLSRADFLRLLFFLRHRPVLARQALDCSAPGDIFLRPVSFLSPGAIREEDKNKMKFQ